MNDARSGTGPDEFLGVWRVSDYIHTPNGHGVGVVRQRRELRRNADGSTKVSQRCQPDENLTNHAMGTFAGEWEFDLRSDGSERHYLGPDVVGRGFEWEPGVMTSAGVWPRFGYSFSSYAVLVAPDRQITGGVFSIAGAPVATIVGIAETGERVGDDDWPELDLDWMPPALTVRDEGALTLRGRRVEGTDGLAGTVRRVGPSLVIDGWLDAHRSIERLVLADAVSQTVRAIELETTHGPNGRRSTSYRGSTFTISSTD